MYQAGRPAPALHIAGLHKRFDAHVAVERIDLAVPRGCLYGLVGPNGAGKSTTMRMASGLLRPDAGVVRVEGVDVWADPIDARRRIGVLPERLALLDRLTTLELLHYVGLLHGLDRATVVDRADALIDVLGLDAHRGALVADLSQGNRKKVGLAQALVHRPSLLLLDEPFESMDPISALAAQRVLRRYVDGGGSVVLSSHVMPVVERCCDRVAVIHRGRIVAGGEIADVCAGRSLEQAFTELVGGREAADEEALWWFDTSSA